MTTAAVQHVPVPSIAAKAWTDRQMDRLRRSCFVQLGEDTRTVRTLGVTPARIAEHLLRAAPRKSPGDFRVWQYSLADVAIVAACIDGNAEAWMLFDELYEKPLIRAAMVHLPGDDAIDGAHELLLDVRQATAGLTINLDTKGNAQNRTANAILACNLRRYTGKAPLEQWLVERIIARIAIQVSTERSYERESERLLRALRLIDSDRMQAEEVVRAEEATGTLWGPGNDQ